MSIYMLARVANLVSHWSSLIQPASQTMIRISHIPFLLLFSCLLLFSHFQDYEAVELDGDDKVYIVYMGAATLDTNKNMQNLLLSSLMRRAKNSLVHNYKHGFTGFAARLSESEAKEMAKQPGVVSVFPDPVFQLHTTRSWEFLLYETALLIDSHPHSNPDPLSQGSDTIIGILDTGIWPESESFNDRGLGPIPSRWNGTCMVGLDFNSSNCNRKLIGARYYDDHGSEAQILSARDAVGHGTHVSSTVAGTAVANASYYGVATGTAKGGSPASRLAMYRVCSLFGCRGSAILAAFDDAIADGVDVLSLSLGSSAIFAPDFTSDPIALGAFHAVQEGITVVCSAGNDGPSPQTVVNVAPWILTVAATTIDRDFESDLVLGNNKVFKGESINFSNLQKSPGYPLIEAVSAKASSAKEDEARSCYPSSLDKEKVEGKIVFCQHNDTMAIFSIKEKLEGVKASGAAGVVFVNDKAKFIATKSGSFPMTVISTKDGAQVLDYINSTRNPSATIFPTETVTNYKPAPTVAYFSSRGPSYTTPNLLKPDIAAPGVNILAAWIANDTSEETSLPGKDPPLFNIISGTSMSCPHAAGVVATVRSQNPNWKPSAVMSAVITTAIQTNNLKEPITTHLGQVATPYDIGAGEVNPTGGIQPGLIYEMDPSDYLLLLCYYGYNTSNIKLIAGQLPTGFSCPDNSSLDMISNLNYPSTAVSRNHTEEVSVISVTRTVTNVDSIEETTYTATVELPKGLEVEVVPRVLKFTRSAKRLSYEVRFSLSEGGVKGDLFGAITWANGKYKVRSPFVVSIN